MTDGINTDQKWEKNQDSPENMDMKDCGLESLKTIL